MPVTEFVTEPEVSDKLVNDFQPGDIVTATSNYVAIAPGELAEVIGCEFGRVKLRIPSVKAPCFIRASDLKLVRRAGEVG